MLATDLGQIHTINQLNEKEVFVGSDQGLMILNVQSGKWDKISSFNSENVLCITKLLGNEFAIGTESGDLYLISSSADHDVSINSIIQIGQPIATVMPDNDNNLWLGTFNGIAAYNQISKAITWIPTAQLTHPECNRYSSFFDSRHNELYIGGIDGVNLINLDQFSHDQKGFDIHFSEIEMGSTSEREKTELKSFGLREKMNFSLPANNRFFSASFYTQVSTLENGMLYEYKMDDSEWRNIGKQNQISFPFLKSGTHRLNVRGVNTAGMYSNNML